jgi:hypothetical protein
MTNVNCLSLVLRVFIPSTCAPSPSRYCWITFETNGLDRTAPYGYYRFICYGSPNGNMTVGWLATASLTAPPVRLLRLDSTLRNADWLQRRVAHSPGNFEWLNTDWNLLITCFICFRVHQ